MNKLSKLLSHSLIFIIIIFSNIQYASALELCDKSEVAFFFVNGVTTEKFEARLVLQEFEKIHGERTPEGEKIKYDVLYNTTDGIADFVETFEQRLLEQNRILEGRYELFFESLRGGGTWWSRITDTVSSSASVLKGIVDSYQASRLISFSVPNPVTIADYDEHRTRLDSQILEGKKILLVAHSQGNLFANVAYKYVISKIDSESVKVVHIAPASPILNGKHILADKDLVINGLRLTGSVPSITDRIPGYLLRPSGVNDQTDISGHGVLEIYINQKLNISTSVKDHINDALTTLVAPPEEATTGFFSATLTWNGSGDVDLHAFEPSSAHVFYRAKQGISGFLDVDNTVANGPEHYYASCDSDKLQAGTYQISVANYNRAEGRTATVQISSELYGVLGTESVTLGAATRDTPTATLFNVIVTKDSETGEYDVSLSP